VEAQHSTALARREEKYVLGGVYSKLPEQVSLHERPEHRGTTDWRLPVNTNMYIKY
jgi:hypothetical protein